jgi:predicted adenylyl cyclase CyaB
MATELEAKYFCNDIDTLKNKLENLGFTCTRERFLMKRYTFALTELNPSPHKWARVRDEGDKVTMAFKQTSGINELHGTEEIEFNVSSFDNAVLFLESLGFKDHMYQEQYREIWQKDEAEVSINWWPKLESFIEIEGPNENIVKTCSENLGFDYKTAIFGGVGNLYAKKDMQISNIKQLVF